LHLRKQRRLPSMFLAGLLPGLCGALVALGVVRLLRSQSQPYFLGSLSSQSTATLELKRDLVDSAFKAVGVVVAYPFITIQNRMIANVGEPEEYKSSLDCFKKTVARDGYGALFAG
jgi:hypothetical protein